MAADRLQNRAVEHVKVHTPASKGQRDLLITEIGRWDLGIMFNIDETREYEKCYQTKLEGRMPYVWAWVAKSTYVGKRNFNGRELDIWEAKAVYNKKEVIAAVGVDASNPNEPVVVERRYESTGAEVEQVHYFDEFKPTATFPEGIFDRPRYCGARR